MKDKILNYLIGGTNHYPFISVFKDIKIFIETYITADPQLVYIIWICLISLIIFIFMFVVLYSLLLAIDSTHRLLKLIYNEFRKI